MTETNAIHHATLLPPGKGAPDFELSVTPDQKVMLSEFRGQPVILAFYPEDWSPVCSDQLALYQAVLPEFRKFNAELVGISVDSVWSHLAFAKDRNLHFPLLSDFEPKGELARTYQVYRANEGTTERAAEAAEAAAAQGRFWEMHDTLYEHQQRLRDEDLRAYAEQLELDLDRFDKEMAEHVHAERIHEDFMSGVRSGVNGTPTFYINDVRHDDSYDADTLLEALDRAESS